MMVSDERAVLIIGGGGREHALAWKIAGSRAVSRVYCAPGNAGTALEPGVENVETGPDGRPFNPSDPQAILALARRLGAGLTVIGPEDPLAAGAVDVLGAAGLAAFGPTRAAARLESSKAFAKEFMLRHGLPTARFEVADTVNQALEASVRFGPRAVIKADGLAAGKGCSVTESLREAEAVVRAALEERVFGEAGARLVIEEALEGSEVSVLGLTDGETVLLLPAARDHKRVRDGDQGPNTGGMGAYSPAPVATPEVMRFALDRVLLPAVQGLAAEGMPYRGVLYAGLMLTRDGPMVLEFNCRFGDPETQVILPLLTEDLVELLTTVARGERLRAPSGHGAMLQTSGRSAVSVVMASAGYPGAYEKGKRISGLQAAGGRHGVKIIHAGTRLDPDGEGVVTSGGRVLNVVAEGPNLREAVREAYRAAALIRFEGAHYRSDIASRALAPEGLG